MAITWNSTATLTDWCKTANFRTVLIFVLSLGNWFVRTCFHTFNRLIKKNRFLTRAKSPVPQHCHEHKIMHFRSKVMKSPAESRKEQAHSSTRMAQSMSRCQSFPLCNFNSGRNFHMGFILVLGEKYERTRINTVRNF